MAAWILPLISGAFSLIGDGVKGFFGVKQASIENVTKVIDVINQSNITAAEREKAISAVIASETGSGYWLAAVWRPLFMATISGLVVAYCFGWTTPNLLVALPEASMMRDLFELLKIGVMGYMPLRTVDKAIDAIVRANVLKSIVEKIQK